MFTTTLVETAAGWLGRRTSRRAFLQRLALVGSAVSVGGLDFVLRPGTAYAAVCGDGASCYSGWTALCCSINNGVNQCPPGSFAAGWWKADGASLCGGKARYYIDCQARCTGCGCPRGSRFCAKPCWNCKPHCAHNGTCDQRRVCHNVFRYGQCHQEIGCSGPVWCRVISCTPPWKFEKCSTSAATDNATRNHSAPCLPSSWTPLQKRYAALGSQGSVLGASADRERDAYRGRYQKFQHGRMYHSERTGTHYVLGFLADRYHHLGESKSELGLPISDTRDNADGGRHNLFVHGAIYASPRTGAHTVLDPIYGTWVEQGRDRGAFGLPTTDTRHIDGTRLRFNDFEHGAIYHHPVLGTHALPEPVLLVWDRYDRHRGPLGRVRTDLVSDVLGTHQDFDHGTITVHETLGVHTVWGLIFDYWAADGREAGPLGFPVSDVYAVDAEHDRCDFEHGSLELDKTTGTVTQV
jgi:uncharacterized protein with LGFP repeats